MCNFFSFVHDGKNIYYFNPEQRKNGVAMPDGNKIYNWDSHSTISCYYGLNDDGVNKFEYNPINDKLILDGKTICSWKESDIREKLSKIDWSLFVGDIIQAKKFLQKLKQINPLRPDGTLKNSDKIKIFKILNEARQTARGKIELNNDVGLEETALFWQDYWDFYPQEIMTAYIVAVRQALGSLHINLYSRDDLELDAALYILTMCLKPKFLKEESINKIKARFNIWSHGYGVLCDVDGILYCYEQP